MKPAEVYQLYIALRLHFSSESYDAIQYNYKTKQSRGLEKRKDKQYFYRLAKHDNPKGYLIANLSIDPNIWIGNLFQLVCQKRYERWKEFRTSSETFQLELKNVRPIEFKPVDNSHPIAFKKYLQGLISLDTLIIVNAVLPYVKYWNEKLQDDPVWKSYTLVFAKYPSLLDYDVTKVQPIIKDWLNAA